MTPEEQRRLEEEQIKKDFSELQQELSGLQSEVSGEDETETFSEITGQLSGLQEQINQISKDTDLNTLKNELAEIRKDFDEFKQSIRGEALDLQNEKFSTPSTYELLMNSETCTRLVNIISSNREVFKNMIGATPEAKLEYMFSKIHSSISLFLKNKLGNNEKYENIIDNTIAPALEWSMMEMLRDQGNEENISMLKGIDGLSRDNLGKLVSGFTNIAVNTKGSYNKFNQWMNAIDYLSVHNGVLRNPNKSAVLTSPIEFKNYLNNINFASESFSPYATIKEKLFKIDGNQTFEFGMSLQEKQTIISQLGNIQVVNNPTTISLIAKMIDKPEKLLGSTFGLQTTANQLLEGVDAINSVTSIFGVDLMGEINKAPEERNFLFKIVDFVCKLIGITGGLEGVVRRWRLDRLNLTDEKNENISQIFKEYQKLAGKGNDISITDENSCKTILNEFNLTDLDRQSTTKGDNLRDSMAENMNINWIPSGVIEQTLGKSYLKKEVVVVHGKQQERVVVDASKITDNEKRELAHKHIYNMKAYLSSNYNNLKEFYSNIHSIDDLAICITSSLYVNKDDIINGIKAKVFLPENYGVEYVGTIDDSDDRDDNGVENSENTTTDTLSDLTSEEKTKMKDLVEQSKKPNRMNYLENPTYKKYLNIIERDLKLPKHSLEAVCNVESYGGYLYDERGNILGSPKGAKGLFQFMDKTSDAYMKHKKLKEKYGKTFTSRTEFLKDPLATAWAAGIMYSEFMYRDNYNFQSALACYNRGPGNYEKHIGKRNLSTSKDLKILYDKTNKGETGKYVENITKKLMELNGISGSDVLTVDLGKYFWIDGDAESQEGDN